MIDRIFLFRSSSIISKKQFSLKFVKKYNLNHSLEWKCIKDTETCLSDIYEILNKQN